MADENVRDEFADESRNKDSSENRGGKNNIKKNKRNRARSVDGKDMNNDFSKPANKVLCYYCRQPAQKKSDCTKRKKDDALITSFVQSNIGMCGDYVVPAVINVKNGMQFCIPCWRDTGAQVSLSLEDAELDSCLERVGKNFSIVGVTSHEVRSVP